jgi:hypothetical protein
MIIFQKDNREYVKAFQNNVSRTFTVNQCQNAVYNKKGRCINIPGTQYYYFTLDSMTADICKDVCVITNGFKFAALYK